MFKKQSILLSVHVLHSFLSSSILDTFLEVHFLAFYFNFCQLLQQEVTLISVAYVSSDESNGIQQYHLPQPFPASLIQASNVVIVTGLSSSIIKI